MLNYLYQDRRDAGEKLANAIRDHHYSQPIILALPRGGVVVADEVASLLRLELEVVIARKIGAPGQPEFGIGAVSEDKTFYYSPHIDSFYDLQSDEILGTRRDEDEELKRRVELYRHGRSLPNLMGRTAIVVDDGLATGVTAIAAAKYLKKLNPDRLILAVPLGPNSIPQDIDELYDEVICLHPLSNMRSVGLWYKDFEQVDDQEVIEILNKYH